MIIISSLRQKLRIFSMVIIIVVALVTIAYRSVANMKYIPYILGNTSKQEFLMTHLNFDFGDFYDENLTIKKMVGEQAVLLLNMHNLFYVDFPFTLSEFNNDKKYKYILVQKGELPQKNLNATLIYENPKTHVKLYKL